MSTYAQNTQGTLPIIAAIQLNASESVRDNLQKTYKLLSEAKSNGAICAVLPECFASMAANGEAAKTAEEIGKGEVQKFLAKTATTFNISIIAGSHRIIVPNDAKQRATNTTLVFSQQGKQIARYDKIHLFDAEVGEQKPYLESDHFKAGQSLSLVDLGFAKIGLSICYDIRFPALYQALRASGADIIVVPAAFTQTTGKAHWQPLLTARAIENQVYIIAAAQTGKHADGRKTWGHSLCIDPWGEIISELANGEGVIYCPFDANKIAAIRRNMPVISHQQSTYGIKQ